jgi:hypothetical protein
VAEVADDGYPASGFGHDDRTGIAPSDHRGPTRASNQGNWRRAERLVLALAMALQRQRADS